MKLVRTQCAGINNSGSIVLMHGDEIESVLTKIWGKIEKCNGGVEKYQAGIWPGHDPHAVGCQELGQILLTGLLGGIGGCGLLPGPPADPHPGHVPVGIPGSHDSGKQSEMVVVNDHNGFFGLF